jgi:DNA-binding MarR family transcriptional regulator
MFRALLRAHALINEEHKRFLAQRGLGLSEFDMIAALGNTQGMRMTDLAQHMITTPSNVTRVCQNLAKQGLVERQRSETSDREVVARLTPQGQKAFEEHFPVMVGFTTGFIDELLPTEEQRQVADILNRLCENRERRSS